MTRNNHQRTWIVQVNDSILGPVVTQARPKGGAFRPAADLPQALRQYLNLPENRRTHPVMGDFKRLEDLDAITLLDEILIRRTRRGHTRVLTIVLPERAIPRKPVPVPAHVPAIRNLRQLCAHFDADTPRGLNRRIYKDTECGASISLLLADGKWLHNGDKGWQTLPITTRIQGFTIQTIVEGSDAEVTSDRFYLPVPTSSVNEWIAEMESEAARLWDEANENDVPEDGDPWVREFGHDYAVPDAVAAAGLIDLSNSGDTCPSFTTQGLSDNPPDYHAGVDVRLWIEHPDPAQRVGGPSTARFRVTAFFGEHTELYRGEEDLYKGAEDIEAAIAALRREAAPYTQTWQVGQRVYWTDPDAGLCSTWATVVSIQEDTLQLRSEAGSEIEAPAHEVSSNRPAFDLDAQLEDLRQLHANLSSADASSITQDAALDAVITKLPAAMTALADAAAAFDAIREYLDGTCAHDPTDADADADDCYICVARRRAVTGRDACNQVTAQLRS